MSSFPGGMGERNSYDLVVQWFSQKLNKASMEMSTNNSSQTNNINGSGSFSMPLDNNSSVGSNSNNNSQTPILSRSRPGLKPVKPHSVPDCLSQHVFSKWSRNLDDEALAEALMDSKHPVEGLKYYDEWTIDLKKLVMGSAFAEGTSGKLFRGKYNGEEVAIKVLERPADKPDIAEDLERQYEQEVMLLATFNHPNIVQFIGTCRKPMVWCILTAYAKGGSVRRFLNNRGNRPMPLKLAVKYALDVAKGMAYIHGLGFIHRDLKSDNLLIAADKSIKIADFGVARVEVHSVPMTPQIGTLRWMAPEMRQNWPYTHKVDVYSFGIVLWELITGLLPFQEMSPPEAAASVVLTDARPPIPKDCPPVLREIMTRCWDKDADSRPPFTEIVTMLENVETEIMTTVRRARFRCCITQPMIID